MDILGTTFNADDSITERKIEDRHGKMNKEHDEPDEPEYDGDNVQMNIEQ